MQTLPWIGPQYTSSPLKICIVGDSHHGGPEDDVRQFTKDTIKDYFSRTRRSYSFFTKLINLTRDDTDQRSLYDSAVARRFYERCCFFNFVDGVTVPASRHRPESQFYVSSNDRCVSIISQNKPDVVLWLGLEVHKYAKDFVHAHTYCSIKLPHPSGGSFGNARRIFLDACEQHGLISRLKDFREAVFGPNT